MWGRHIVLTGERSVEEGRYWRGRRVILIGGSSLVERSRHVAMKQIPMLPSPVGQAHLTLLLGEEERGGRGGEATHLMYPTDATSAGLTVHEARDKGG